MKIDINGASYATASREILHDITLQGNARRIGIVGRNGSGKSTLARMLAGLVSPTKGTVRIDGLDLANDRHAALRKVGILFQNPDHQIIFPTVEEEIGFGLTQMGQGKAEVHSNVTAQLDLFGKSHWANAPVHQLSQGQKQLVCLMSILAMSPSLIVLDEPFSGLDIPTRLQLERHIEKISQTVIHISHDPTALARCDHVVWLEDGTTVQQGQATPVLKEFVAHMIRLGGQDDISDLTG